MTCVFANPILDLLCTILGWIGQLIPLLISVAVLTFLWGMVKFVRNADDERAHEEGKKFMVWGIIGLFVMVSFWGIVGFMQESVELTPMGGATPSVPVNLP